MVKGTPSALNMSFVGFSSVFASDDFACTSSKMRSVRRARRSLRVRGAWGLSERKAVGSRGTGVAPFPAAHGHTIVGYGNKKNSRTFGARGRTCGVTSLPFLSPAERRAHRPAPLSVNRATSRNMIAFIRAHKHPRTEDSRVWCTSLDQT